MLVSPAVRPSRGPDKRAVLVASLVALTALAFWTGSRYPALGEKAAMGETADVEGLAFDRVVSVDPAASAVVRVGANAVNWAYTNKQGMTFGVLFAALVLTGLPLASRRRFEGSMPNTLLGVAMGAPLGVCVNCAVPIAEGLHQGGARGETTVAALLSSPTLNVVVLSMTFALFPLWLAGLKLGLTLAFIVLAVPLIVRALWGEQPGPAADALAPAGATLGPDLPAAPALDVAVGADIAETSWAGAAAWTGRTLARNLWYIVKTTVPLMLLAGALGAVVVTLLPWETLTEALPALDPGGRTKTTVAVLAGVALLGTFLPVPIAFDVIICAILSAAGVPVSYVAVLFVTLGLFSAYPLLQIWRTMSRRAAVGLFLGVAALGVTAGWTAAIVQDRVDAQAEALALAVLADPDGPPLERPRYAEPGLPADEVAALLAPTAVRAEPWRAAGGLTVSREPLAALPAEGPDGIRFERAHGHDLGFAEPSNATANRLILGVTQNRGVASGDVHGDGWPDVVMTSEAGVGLYANVGGRRFVRQEVAVPALDAAEPIAAALVDLDGDGALDLFVSAVGANHVVYNEGGAFTEAAHHVLPGLDGHVASMSLAFGDLDGDGDLDVVAGNGALLNTNIGPRRTQASLETARNAVLTNEGGRGRFTAAALPGVPGESLSVLLTDLDGDGALDLFVGNDFNVPDVVYLGDGAGGLRPVTRDEGFVPVSSFFTMSLASADLDGDLVPEVLASHTSRRPGAHADERSAEALCAERAPADRPDCLRYQRLADTVVRNDRRGSPAGCLALGGPLDVEGCVARYVFRYQHVRDLPTCGALDATDRWPHLTALCYDHRRPAAAVSEAEVEAAIPQVRDMRSVLLRREGARYTDVAVGSGLERLGWSWNARFADFDLDGRLDLFVTNGISINANSDQTGVFRNRGGLRFEDVSEASGAGLWANAYAHTVVDLDRDGDPDVVVPTVNGPVDVFRNRAGGRALQIALRDDASANRDAVGAVVTVTLDDGSRQRREVQMSGGYVSFDEPVLTFGLGEAGAVTRVEVRWPTGERSVVDESLAAGARYTLRRG